MRTLLLLALAVIIAGLPGSLPAAPGDPVATNFEMEPAPGGKVVVKWQAAAGTSQLYWASSLDNTATWQPLAGSVPRPDNFWQTEFLTSPARAFFRVQPPETPVPPPNVRLVMVGDHFRLEWDSTSDAGGYAIYIGTTPGTGPGNFLQRLPLPLANAMEITGLTSGQTYYITIAATNAAGEGAPAAVLSGVYGPKVDFSGRAVYSFLLPSGAAFQVLAEGTILRLVRTGGGDGAGYVTTVNAQGEFSLQNLPAGSYLISYFVNGQWVLLPAPARIWPGTAASVIIVLPSGPSPPPPGTTLLGYLNLSNGLPARISVPEFGLNAQAQLMVQFADGSTRIVIPDSLGAWAVPEITGGFPVTITATYQGITTVTFIPAPPATLAPAVVQFPQLIPSLQRLTIHQNGHEVLQISPGAPVTFMVEVTNPGGVPPSPHWIVEYNGVTHTSTNATLTITFGSPGATTGGTAHVQYIPSNFVVNTTGNYEFSISLPPSTGEACWSGITGIWDPAAPNDILPAHPASIFVKYGGGVRGTNTMLNQNGVSWFDMPVDPVFTPPYYVRVDKPGHMPFIWPFEFQLPKESTFCVVPATTTAHNQSSGNTLTVTHSSGASLSLPYGSLYDGNTPWLGPILVSMVSWDPLVRSPLPPGLDSRGPGPRRGILPYSAVWFNITTNGGVSLRPVVPAPASASQGPRIPGDPPPVPTLTLPTAVDYPSSQPCYHQVENTGYFENWGAAPGYLATRTAPRRYTVQLGDKGLFLLAAADDLKEAVFMADRSLNYPFEMLVNQSIFPVTVVSEGKTNFGHLYLPETLGADVSVLDLLQAPGIHYTNPANASLTRPVEPMRKKVILWDFNVLNGPVAALPAISAVVVPLSLSRTEPKLKKHGGETTVSAIDGPKKFLSKTSNEDADAVAYYAKIDAPKDLAGWRTKRGFPAGFGDPLPGQGLDTYATCYYYNLGDLGFARAQTMRITSGADNQPDVAFAVTNYRTLEDARCRRSPVATVCMDHSLLNDAGEATATRYTRFYVYGGNGLLLNCANLDGAGNKCIPNLCVICHGGRKYSAGDSANLGSRFLPFDVASYSYHPQFGVQKQEMAAMNAGVLKAQPADKGAAIKDLITGWYNNANPLAGPATYNAFNQDYVPSTTASLTWKPGNEALYTNVFKHSCRVCHISRDETNRKQIGSFSLMSNLNFGYTSSCTGLGMPHSQRTWGVFWGSRCSNKLGIPNVPDMPTLLNDAAVEAGCPVVPDD